MSHRPSLEQVSLNKSNLSPHGMLCRLYCHLNTLWHNSQGKNTEKTLFKNVQVFCEEKVLRHLFGVFGNAESKN